MAFRRGELLRPNKLRLFSTLGGRTKDVVDRVRASDPGFNRLRSALMTVITIGLILEVEDRFVRLTHGLQVQTRGENLSHGSLVAIAQGNHAHLVIMLLLGAIIGMVGGFGVSDATAKGQLMTTLFFPVVMIPALALGIVLGGHRALSLVLLALILSAGTYLRRFGPRGMVSGMLLFMGFFFGFFLHAIISLRDFGWVCSAIGLGLAVALFVRFVFFYPRPAKALRRTQRSFSARARRVAFLTLLLFKSPERNERTKRKLRSSLVQLDEAGLMIDAQLANPQAVADGVSPRGVHQDLFDFELALTNVARFGDAIASLDFPSDQRAQVELILQAIVDQDDEGVKRHADLLRSLLAKTPSIKSDPDRTSTVLAHRFFDSVIGVLEGRAQWLALSTSDEAKELFVPAVALFGGWLPGSTQVSSIASDEPGERPSEQRRFKPYTRAAIQMGIAVGASIVLGDVLSPSRFYWAVIAVFVTFMGANNSSEQVRKGLLRVIGTVIGVVVGSLIATAIGHNATWSIAIILLSLFLGFYLMRVNYAFLTIGITVTVSQLYSQLGEFTNSLLLVRVEETAIGAGVVIVVVLTILPLRTQRVLRVALRSHLQALSVLVGHTADQLLGRSSATVSTLRDDARALDATYQALVTTAQPLHRSFLGTVDEENRQLVRLVTGTRDYARGLVTDVERGPLAIELFDDVERATSTLRSSLELLTAAATGSRDGTYTRSGALFDRVERHLEEKAEPKDEGQLALRDYVFLDGALARMALLMGLSVKDLDTQNVGDHISFPTSTAV